MDVTKSRPTVTITTYSASNSSYLKHPSSLASQRHQVEGGGGEEYATKCEFSTNLFRNNIRQLRNSVVSDDRSQQSLLSANARACRRQGMLSDLSQIRGPTGSVRGHKDVVRKSLEGIKVTYHNRFMNLSSSTSSASSSSSSTTSFSSSSGGGSSLVSFSTFFASQSAARQQGNVTSGCIGQSSLTSFSANNRFARLSTTSSSLLTINNELYCSEYLERLVEDEQNLCVAYTTTLGVIRRTFVDSKILRSILDLNLVKYEERDIYLNQEYKSQLKMRLGSIVVPALFVDGIHIGGAKELETMNENGELQKLFAKFKMTKAPKDICHCCGNAKFIACQSCNGSRKSTIHHFKFNSIALRCIKCDNNDGLVQCPVCCVGQASTCKLDNFDNYSVDVADDVTSSPVQEVVSSKILLTSADDDDKNDSKNLLEDLNNNNNFEC